MISQGFIMAQNRVEFVIKNSASNETIIGVNVVLKGTTTGSISDVNGFVKLENIPNGNQIIEFSFIGYKKMDIPLTFPLQKQEKPMLIVMSEEIEQIEEVVVSATRNNSRIEDSPTKIEVLGSDDMIEENGIKPGNIASILGDIGGIQMQQTSAASGNMNARIQGLNGRYSQILKDGMPLYGGFSGSFGILQIPPLDLKQIEIIKGSSSTLFGGDAIGGIINLVSKTPMDKPETNFLINQTTLNETDINTYISRKYKKIGFTLFTGYVFQKATDVNNDGFSDVPNLGNFIIHPKLFLYLDKKSTLSVGFSGTYENRKGGDMEVVQHKANALHQYFIAHTSNRNTVDLTFDRKEKDGSGLLFKGSSSFLNRSIETQHYRFDGNQNLYFSELSYLLKRERYSFVFGTNVNGDIFRKKESDSINIGNYKYSTIGFFMQNDLKITNKLLIESGFRYDYHSKYGGFALPQVSVMYKILPQLTVRINGGYGYKIPVTFGYIDEETDLNHIQPLSYSLKPETSQGANFDINYQTLLWKSLSITLNQSFFFTLLSNPIAYSVDSTATVHLVNAPKPVETKGLQSYLRLSYEKYELYLSYVYTHAIKQYDSQNPWFLATPKHNLAATLTYEPSKSWRIGFEGSMIGKQYIENNKQTSSYLFLALMTQFNYKKFSFVLNCENLLDFRQKDFMLAPFVSPTVKPIWAPIDGRVFNLSVNLKL